VIEYRVPGGGDPHTIVLDAAGTLWFTVQNGQRVGRLDRGSGRIDEFPMSGNPYGLTIDLQGIVSVCRLGADALGWIDPASGESGELPTGKGSAPRRIATAPCGSPITAMGGLQNSTRRRAVSSRPGICPRPGANVPMRLPSMAGGASGSTADTVSVFDPAREDFRVIALPSKNAGIRKAIVDAQGRYWYMGSHNDRLGVVQ